MIDPILDDLNEPQRAAVLHGEGPMLVLAGAGSGKTRVITRRIARLLRDGVPGKEILALTFTNKAAGEMARRVRDAGGGWVRVSTFHSACARFMREDGARLGYPRDFTIYDTYDRDSAIKQLMQEKGLDKLGVRPAAVGRRISQLKNVGMTPSDFIVGRGTLDQVVESCFDEYQQMLLRNGAMDFDDLLVKFVELLREHPDVAEAYQERFRWLLVDEFQDTNRVQYDLMRRLISEPNNVCVVGDSDQSIYRFRGADIRNILDFENDYPEVTTIRLEQNYRSTACILRAAESVITNNEQRHDKRLHTEAGEGLPITFERAAGPAQEARAVAEQIESLVADEDVELEEIAIFYRSHFLSRALEEAFRAHGVPHRIVGGLTFFERREIKDLLAYLRVIVNPLDDVSMARVINVPPRGIGKVTLLKLRDAGAREGCSLSEVVCEPSLLSELSARPRNKLAALAAVIEEARAKAVSGAGAHAVLRLIAEGVGYLDHISGIGEPEDEARLENVQELHSDAAAFDADVGGGLSAYLQHVSLLTEQDRNSDDRSPKVSMMTVHAAKGLEFDHVFVSGLEDGLFPHIRSLEEGDEAQEEERRLMYVAITRARKTLWLGSCRTRMVNGQLQRQSVSSFIDEIDPSCLSSTGAERSASRQMLGTFGDQDSVEDDAMMDAQPEPFGDPFSQVEVSLEPGVRVVHAVYGLGTVLETQGQGFTAKVRVKFETGQVRLLVVEHAGLQIVPAENSW